MKPSASSDAGARLQASARAAAAVLISLTALVAVAALAGWLFDLPALRRVYPGSVAMNPMTAAAFLLAAGAAASRNAAARRTLAGLVAAIGVVRLLGYLAGAEGGIDAVLFAEKLQAGGAVNRMAPNTAACFVLAGAGLFPAASWAAPAGLLIAAVAFLGHLYGVMGLYVVGRAIGMAVNTAVAFMALFAGILLSRPDTGIMLLLTSPRAGGAVARRLLPAAVTVPVALGALRLWGESSGVFSSVAGGVATLVSSCVLVISAAVYLTARETDALDAAREAAVAEIGEYARRLEASNEELEAFSYSVSHDLRAPLRHIDGFIDLLAKRAGPSLDAESREHMAVIGDAARRMGALIDSLLAYSRMGREELRRGRVDLGPLVRAAIAELGPAADGRRVEWRVGELPAVEGDPAMLRLVLSNLLGNALKFTRGRDPAVIEVDARRDGGRAFVAVRDNGAGFDMRYAGKLFGVFQRLHREDEFEGTGIGLASVRRIVRRHGGEVRAEGRLGQGAVFTFDLPCPA